MNTRKLAKVIMNVVMQYHGLSDFIISEQSAIFRSKFWFSLCYFRSIKKRLSTAFYLGTNMQTEWQNSIIKAYLYTFVNWEQNNRARLLLMTEFTYNNSKNASIDHTLFKLNYSYYSCVFFENKCDARSKSFSVKGLFTKLKELINFCCQNFLHA